jgi:hypothetical protein
MSAKPRAVADDALSMLGTKECAFGVAGDVVTESRLSELYASANGE